MLSMKPASFFVFFIFILMSPLQAASKPLDLAVVGGGPAGLTAAIYAGRLGIDCTLFEGDQPGGQLTYSSEVENYPGFFPSASGGELMQLMHDQAKSSGATLSSLLVKKIDLLKRPFELHLSDGRVQQAWAIILAVGAKAKRLDLESEKKFWGQGVSSCALCDGAFYQNQDVVVVGGGDVAFDDALLLSKIARKVTLVHRSGSFRASHYLQELLKKQPNVEFKLYATVEEILGSGTQGVTGVRLRDHRAGSDNIVSCQGVFIAIGHEPDTTWLPKELRRDARGYIELKPGTNETSIPGVFAAGDVCDSRYRQAITAAASGCRASIEAREYLNHLDQE